MPGLVRHVAAEVPADDAVPRGVVLLVELLLDVAAMSFSAREQTFLIKIAT